jgi:S1-C subfamily serine protease
MKGWRIAAVVAALLTAAAIGVVLMPAAYGQSAVTVQSPKAIEIFSRGSRIGVTVRDLEEADRSAAKGVTGGVVIDEVAADSPAAKAGLRNGDVMVEFDGERVRSARQLTRLVQETPSGRSVTATLIRDGQKTNVTVTPDESGAYSFDGAALSRLQDLSFRVSPKLAVPVPPSPPKPPAIWRFDELLGGVNRLGVTLDALSPQLAEYFGTKTGVLVSSVHDNSAAAKAGLKAGDVITTFDGSPVDDPGDVRRRIQNLQDGAEFTINVMRDRKTVTLKGKNERTERRRTFRTVI